MTKYSEAAVRLIAVVEFLEKNDITQPRTEFTSIIGEWLVMDQLLQHGYAPTHESGQNDVDIVLENGQGVEVKSAIWSPRQDGVWIFDRIEPEKLDYLVSVKFGTDYSEADFYVFSHDDVQQFPPRNRTAFDDPERDGETRILRILENIERANSPEMRTVNERLTEFNDAWHKLPGARAP